MDGMEAGAQGSGVSLSLCPLPAAHTGAQHTRGGATSRKAPTHWKGDIANSWQLLCESKLQKTETSMIRTPVLGGHFGKELFKLH